MRRERFLLAVGACALVAAATAHGFFLALRPLLVAVLPSILAAAALRRPSHAAWAAAAGTALGAAAAPLAIDAPLLAGTATAASVAATLAAVWTLLRRPVLIGLALAFIVLTLASTAWIVARGPRSGTPPLAQALAREPAPGTYWSDESIYSRVMHRTAHGASYYSAVRLAWNQKVQARGDPPGVFSFRLPTLSWMAAALPGGPATLIPAMIGFGGLASLAAYRLAARMVRPAFALVGATLVAVYYTRLASSSHLLQADGWGAALALAAAASWVSALTTADARARNRWTWCAAALGLGGALFREHVASVPLAAWIVSVSLRGERERRAWLPWSAALGLFAIVLAVHAYAASLHISGSAFPLGRWVDPGTRHLGAALSFSTQLLGGQPWLPWLLALLALCGAARLPVVEVRLFLILACSVPLAALLVLRPPGWLPGGGQPGYWGACITPVLWATVACAFGERRLNPRTRRSYVRRGWSERRTSC